MASSKSHPAVDSLVIDGTPLGPSDSCSNGSILSSNYLENQAALLRGLVPPVMPVFTVPVQIATMTDVDVARVLVASARDAYQLACDAYATAYAAYVGGLTSMSSTVEVLPTVPPAGTTSPVRPYGQQFDACSSARSKGWRDGTSFGNFQYSTRGSTASSVLSSSLTQYPQGKCYLAIVAGGHKRSTQMMLGRWPSFAALLRAPAVKFDVSAMLQLSFQVTDGMTCHVVPYSGCSVMAALAAFVSRNAGSLGVQSSVWEGSLLHAIMSRGDFAQLLDSARAFRVATTAIVGGSFPPESALSDSDVCVRPSYVDAVARAQHRFDVESSGVFSAVRVRTRSCEPSSTTPSTGDDGLCYAGLFKVGVRASVVAALGHWPSVVRLMHVPAVYFHTLATLAGFRVVGGCERLHVTSGDGFGTSLMDVFREYATEFSFPVGSIGSVASFLGAPHFSGGVVVGMSVRVGGDCSCTWPGANVDLRRAIVSVIGDPGLIGVDRYHEFVNLHPFGCMRTAIHDLVYSCEYGSRLRHDMVRCGDVTLHAFGVGADGGTRADYLFSRRRRLLAVDGLQVSGRSFAVGSDFEAIYDDLCALFSFVTTFCTYQFVARFLSDVFGARTVHSQCASASA